MKLSALLQGVETPTAFQDVEIERVTDKDTEISKNTLFVCIDGNRCDGHSLAQKALKNGAVAVVTNRDLQIDKQILVADSRKALAQIAANFYGNPAKKLKLIGITGTNGKTSTTFFIKQILKAMGHKCGVIGTVENSLGEGSVDSTLTTPEPMELHRLLKQMADNNCEYVAMEVSSQALSQQRVCGLRFSAAALTNITGDHLDYHINMENYINAKLILFEQSDFACINIDDENSQNSLSSIKCPVKTYSALSNSADYTAKNIFYDKNGVNYLFVGLDCIGKINVRIPGRFTVYNSLCATSILLGLGHSIDEITKSVENITTVKGRAETVEIPRSFRVMIDYAHTPDGLMNILNCVREITRGRVITVFGCGGDRDKTKRAEMGEIAGQYSDIAVVTSDNPRTENPLLIINDILCGMEKSKARIAVIENRRQAIEFALGKAKKGDTVLLAGKGHETYQIIGKEKIPFDERKIVKEFFNKN